MKKLLLTAALLTGGLSLPSAAQQRGHCNTQTEVYISGYLPCGSPIYSRRYVTQQSHNHQYEYQLRLERERELRRRMEIQRQMEIRREIERQRYLASLRYRGGHGQQHCR